MTLVHTNCRTESAGDQPGITVAICCHNSSERLPETIRHLQRQEHTDKIQWEVLVIDNASSDPTAEVAEKIWTENPVTKLRVIDEPRPGLSNARLSAFQNARFGVVGFIDDDNWASPDWVVTAAVFMHQHPDVGAAGGVNELPAGTAIPDWFGHARGFLAVGCPPGVGHLTEPVELDPRVGVPAGAGLLVRCVAIESLVLDGFGFLSSDRMGKSLSGGGDLEISWALAIAGWKIYYNPALRLIHAITGDRMTPEYVRRLRQSAHLSLTGLDAYGFVFQLLDGRANPVDLQRIRFWWAWRLASQMRSVSRTWLKWKFGRHSSGDSIARGFEHYWSRGRALAYIRLRGDYRNRIKALIQTPWVAKVLCDKKIQA